MKVAPFDDVAWRVDHPLGTVSIQFEDSKQAV
jgi:hypothetical protein